MSRATEGHEVGVVQLETYLVGGVELLAFTFAVVWILSLPSLLLVDEVPVPPPVNIEVCACDVRPTPQCNVFEVFAF